MGVKKLILLFQQGQDYSDQPGEDGKILFVMPENKKFTTFSPAAKTKSGLLLRTEKKRVVEETIYCIFKKMRENTNLAQGLKMGGEGWSTLS